jgi:hypothetical protein
MNIKKLPNGNLEITIHQLEQNALKPVGKRLQTSSYERKFIGTFPSNPKATDKSSQRNVAHSQTLP